MASSDGLLGAAEIRRLAEELELAPTKRMGQNFVIDPNTVRRIVRLADVSADDIVVEVGPGLGSLTLGLLAACQQVVAIEIDERLAGRLPVTAAEYAPDRADRLTVIAGDALAVPMPLAGVEPTALVANLPYNVAVPIVLRLLSELPTVRHGLVMVQLEVAQRLAAGPGSRVYGVPSVKMQWFGSVESAGTVGPNVFWPAPRVDSGLVRFTRHPAPECASSRAEVFACIDAGFSQRRKKLRSALAGWAGGVSAADEILERASVDSAARGEDLTLSSFVRIADARREVTPA